MMFSIRAVTGITFVNAGVTQAETEEWYVIGVAGD
jgi:hypothetical protein